MWLRKNIIRNVDETPPIVPCHSLHLSKFYSHKILIDEENSSVGTLSVAYANSDFESTTTYASTIAYEVPSFRRWVHLTEYGNVYRRPGSLLTDITTKNLCYSVTTKPKKQNYSVSKNHKNIYNLLHKPKHRISIILLHN